MKYEIFEYANEYSWRLLDKKGNEIAWGGIEKTIDDCREVIRIVKKSDEVKVVVV